MSIYSCLESVLAMLNLIGTVTTFLTLAKFIYLCVNHKMSFNNKLSQYFT